MQICKLFPVELATLTLVLASASCLPADENQNPPAPQAEVAVVQYNGMTYDEALAEFQRDLSPSLRTRSLEALIQFAIHDHHQEEVAGLLVKESRTIPLDFLGMGSGESSERMLAGFLERMGKAVSRPNPELDSEVVFTQDEMRHWIRVTAGVYRLAEPQRKVFEQAARDSKSPLSARFLARMAVQEADVRAKAEQELLELLPPESKAAAVIPFGGVTSASVQVSSPAKP